MNVLINKNVDSKSGHSCNLILKNLRCMSQNSFFYHIKSRIPKQDNQIISWIK